MNHEHILIEHIICVILVGVTLWNAASVTSSPTVLPLANTRRKIPLETNFIYLGNSEIYCIFKMCFIMSVLFSTKYYVFYDFIFFYSNNMFLINCVLIFKYPPWLTESWRLWHWQKGNMKLDCMAFKSCAGSLPYVDEFQQCANHSAEY